MVIANRVAENLGIADRMSGKCGDCQLEGGKVWGLLRERRESVVIANREWRENMGVADREAGKCGDCQQRVAGKCDNCQQSGEEEW